MNRQVGFECQLCREWYFLRARFEAHLQGPEHEASKQRNRKLQLIWSWRFRKRHKRWPFTSFTASSIKGG